MSLKCWESWWHWNTSTSSDCIPARQISIVLSVLLWNILKVWFFQGHLYSLGRTLFNAMQYATGEQGDYSDRLKSLVGRMTRDDFEGRATLDYVQSACRTALIGQESVTEICQRLVSDMKFDSSSEGMYNWTMLKNEWNYIEIICLPRCCT